MVTKNIYTHPKRVRVMGNFNREGVSKVKKIGRKYD